MTTVMFAAGVALVMTRTLTLSRFSPQALRARAVRRRAAFLVSCCVLGSVHGMLLSKHFIGDIEAEPYAAAFVLAGALIAVTASGLVVDTNAASVGQLLRQSSGYSLVVGSLASALVTAFTGNLFPFLPNVIFWATTTVLVGLVFGRGHGWMTFFVGTRIAACRNVLPRRTAEFLDWCIDVGLLRMSGQDLQFRHQDLRDWLIRTGDRDPTFSWSVK